MKAVGTVRLYGCGGTGVNLVKDFINAPTNEMVADIKTCLIDTSDSNLSDIKIDSDVYLLPKVDGSGKVRAKNYPLISDRMGEITSKFDPMDLNIIVCSAAGGSGSVIAPLLASELLEAKQPVVIIAVASFESIIAANNTIKTIESFAGIAEMVDAPVVVRLENNSKHSGLSKGRAEVDRGVKSAINALCLLSARNHAELDRADIHSWAFFDEVTGVNPGFSMLDIVSGDEDVMDIQYPISIASLIAGETSIDEAGADYQCSGYVSDDAKTLMCGENLHFVISTSEADSMISKYEEMRDNIVKRSKARPNTKLSKGTAGKDDRGMVL